MQIKQNIPLFPYTTFGIGGNARFFVKVSSADELAEAVKFANDHKLVVFVLGGGSNILISDKGFGGLVIKMDIRGVGHDIYGHGVSIYGGAGEMWDDVVAKVVELNVGGIENLSLIPGTVGGAVYQNIGAYGAELKDVLNYVKAYNIATNNIVRLSNKECGFEYRSSIFKKNKNLIILEAELLLLKDNKSNLTYSDLEDRFRSQNPSIAQIRDAVIEIRKSKIPYPDEVGNAGSFFKNPIVTLQQFSGLKNKYSDLRGSPVRGQTSLKGVAGRPFLLEGRFVSNEIKLSAAQLIEKAGFKGRRVGNVGVSKKHALVLVNYGNGTAKELAGLAERVKIAVESEFGVKLETEVEKI